MKCTLEVSIDCKDAAGHRVCVGRVAKEVDVPIVPAVGTTIECGAWKMMEDYRVKNVTLSIDPDTNVASFSVFCGQDSMESPEMADSRIRMYEDWGWECRFRDASLPKQAEPTPT